MAQQLQATPPKNDPAHELQAIPANSHPKVVYVRLRYDWSSQEGIDSQHWQSHVLAFHQNEPYTMVLEDIAVYVHEKLMRFAPALHARLDRSKSCIVLQFTLQSSDKLKRHACRLDASDTSRLNRIRDLYESELRPELSVLLVSKPEENRNINGVPRSISIRTRDDAAPFAEDDPTHHCQCSYKFWDLTLARPDIAIFPIDIPNNITITTRFVQHLEPAAMDKFDFVQNARTTVADDTSFTTFRNHVLSVLEKMEGAKALSRAPYFIGDNCDIEFWINPQNSSNMFRWNSDDTLIRQFLYQVSVEKADTTLTMEVHIVPIESIPADEPTDEVLNDAEEDQLHIRLTYDMRGLPNLRTMHETSQVLQFSRTYGFQDLFDYLAEFVESKLAQNEKECYNILGTAGSEHYLLLRPLLVDPCPVKRRAFTFDDSNIARVDTIDDLLCDVGGEDGIAEVDATPQLNIRLQLVETLKCTVPTDPKVVIQSGVKTKDSAGQMRFYRIGCESREQPKNRDILTSETYFWRHSLVSGKFTLVKSRTWTLRDFDICNPDEGKHATVASIDTALRRHHGDVAQKVKEFEEDLLGGLITPFVDGRLMYNFKTFGEGTNCCPEPVDAVPSSGISAALRFVNHLEGEGASKISFSDNSELFLDHEDNFGSICKEIVRKLNGKEHGNIGALLKKPLAGQWEMQLWVLPQDPNGKTLFKYSNDVAGLHCFLNKPEVDKGDLTLFMEVHLVPKKADLEKVAASKLRAARAGKRALRN